MSEKTPTPGPWTVNAEDYGAGLHWVVQRPCLGNMPITVEDRDNGEADAELIAAAGTAAHQAAQQGYDPVEAVKALPELLAEAGKLANEAAGSAELARECIGNTNANCLQERATRVRYLLALAAGKGGE